MIPNRMGGGRYGLPREIFRGGERCSITSISQITSLKLVCVYGKGKNQTPGGGVKAVF